MLKPDREELVHDVSFYMDEVAERGGIACMLTAGSGGGWKTVMGDTMNVATYAANPTGKIPLGILLNDQVNLEYTGLTRAQGQKDEMPVGMKCTLLRRGWVVTNKYVGAPVGGNTAYVGPSGSASPTSSGNGPAFGTFLGSPDEDGYVRLEVLL